VENREPTKIIIPSLPPQAKEDLKEKKEKNLPMSGGEGGGSDFPGNSKVRRVSNFDTRGKEFKNSDVFMCPFQNGPGRGGEHWCGK